MIQIIVLYRITFYPFPLYCTNHARPGASFLGSKIALPLAGRVHFRMYAMQPERLPSLKPQAPIDAILILEEKLRDYK